MRDETIAKNYAEALLALANKANAPEEWGGMIHAVASAIESNITLQRFLAAPQVSGVEKQAILAYSDLLDLAAGRVHARVTVARAMSDADRDALAAQLTKVLKKTVVPHLTVNEQILGGVVVRVGDTVMDGSVRRRLETVRAKMLGATT